MTGSRSCFYDVVQLIFPAAALPQLPCGSAPSVIIYRLAIEK